MKLEPPLLDAVMDVFSKGTGRIDYALFCENVMEVARTDGASLVLTGDRTNIERTGEQQWRHAVRAAIKNAGSDLRHMFQDLDVTGRGALTRADLQLALERFRIKLPPLEFEKMWRHADANDDGVITYPEMASYFKKHMVDTTDYMVQRMMKCTLPEALGTIRQRLLAKVGSSEHSLHKAFRVFDKDGSGTIDINEMFSCLRSDFHVVFDPETERMIMETLDNTNSGELSFQCFSSLVMGFKDQVGCVATLV